MEQSVGVRLSPSAPIYLTCIPFPKKLHDFFEKRYKLFQSYQMGGPTLLLKMYIGQVHIVLEILQLGFTEVRTYLTNLVPTLKER